MRGDVTETWQGTSDDGATDASPNGKTSGGVGLHDASVTGACTWSSDSPAGATGGSLAFGAAQTGYVQTAADPLYEATGPFTIALWVKLATLTHSGSYSLVDYHATGSEGYNLSINADNTLTWTV